MPRMYLRLLAAAHFQLISVLCIMSFMHISALYEQSVYLPKVSLCRAKRTKEGTLLWLRVAALKLWMETLSHVRGTLLIAKFQ